MKKISLLFLIATSFILNPEWIRSFSILTNGDWLYQYPATLKELVTIPIIWSSTSIGGINIASSFYPFELMFGLLAKLGFNFGFIERAIFMWPILFALPVFSYMLFKKNINSSFAAAIGSLVYSYNTYFSEIKTGHLTLLMAYAVAPLVILFYQKTLEKKDIRYAFLTGIFGFIVSFYEFRAFYLLCVILFLYLAYYVLLIEKKKNVRGIIKNCFFAGLPVFVSLLLNLYWLLPLGRMGTLGSNVIFNRSLFGDEFLNINYAITLLHPFWTGSKTAVFVVQTIPFYFWLIPIFAFLGLLLNKKNKQILFFGLIALLGIFLTKQVGHPFIDIYPWLYKYFPGFNAFREASKFYFLIALGYSVLIAGFIDWIWRTWGNTRWQKFGKYFFIILVAVIFLWNTKPFITGEIATLFVPRAIPEDYLIVNNFILKQDNYFRTLWAPVGSRWATYTNEHPIIYELDVISANWSAIYKTKNITINQTYGQSIIDFLKHPKSNNLLDLSSVKYVFVPLEDKENDDDFFIYYGKPRQYYINELERILYLHKINIGTKEIVAYENENYRPHIYITNNQESINKNQPFAKIDYKFVNPTEYTFSIKNVLTPFYLNFSESYHPQWNLRVGNFNWLNVLRNKSYFISNKYHKENDAGLNSYYINPIEVCLSHEALVKGDKVGNGCVINADGSYDISGTLYFAPQSYMNLGLIISGATLAIVIGYLIFTGGRNLYERKNK